MSDPAVYVILSRGVARVGSERHAGSLAPALLESGPEGCIEHIESMFRDGEIRRDGYAGGVLIDRDRRRVLYCGEVEGDEWRARWDRWELVELDHCDAIRRYVEERGALIEPADRIFVADTDREHARERIAACAGEWDAARAAELNALELDAPPAPKRRSWSFVLLAPLLILAALIGAVGALALLPWRRRLQVAAALRERAAPPRAAGSTEEELAAAVERHSATLASAPDDYAALRGRADAYRMFGGFDQAAERDLDRAVAIAKREAPADLPRLLFARAQVLEGLRLHRLGAADRARAAALGEKEPRPTIGESIATGAGFCAWIVRAIAVGRLDGD